MIRQLLLLLLLGVVLLVSCEIQDLPATSDLNGHWHIIEKINNIDSSVYTQFQPIEIFNDTSIAINELFDDFLMDNGGIDIDKKTIYLRIGHSYLPFMYSEISKDSILLHGNGLYNSMYMVRIYHTEETLKYDITRDSRIQINPIEINVNNFKDSISLSLMHDLQIGYKTDSLIAFKVNEYTVQDHYALNDAMLELERHKMKLPEKMRSKIIPVLTLDRNIPSDTVLKVAGIFDNLHFDTLLFIYRISSDGKNQKFGYLNIPTKKVILQSQRKHSKAGEIVKALSPSPPD